MTTNGKTVRKLPALLRGELGIVPSRIESVGVSQTMTYLALIILGTGAFGAAIGFWRAPLQAIYAAAKLPLVIILTTYSNALLNGMLAPLLGLNIGFRQSLVLILTSFVIASAILGSFSPLVLFLIWNVPPASVSGETTQLAYGFLQLALAAIIAFAGVMANWRLLPLLREHGASRSVANRVLFAWLAGNLFLGSQFCWMLRPFVGKPDLPVEFLGPGLHEGNFFETIFDNVRQLAVKMFNHS